MRAKIRLLFFLEKNIQRANNGDRKHQRRRKHGFFLKKKKSNEQQQHNNNKNKNKKKTKITKITLTRSLVCSSINFRLNLAVTMRIATPPLPPPPPPPTPHLVLRTIHVTTPTQRTVCFPNVPQHVDKMSAPGSARVTPNTTWQQNRCREAKRTKKRIERKKEKQGC